MIRILEVPVSVVEQMEDEGFKLNILDEPVPDVATIEIESGIVKLYAHDKAIAIDQAGKKFLLEEDDYHRIEME